MDATATTMSHHSPLFVHFSQFAFVSTKCDSTGIGAANGMDAGGDNGYDDDDGAAAAIAAGTSCGNKHKGVCSKACS
jgi:hypothetical protein